MPAGLFSFFHRIRFFILLFCALAALAGAWLVPQPDPVALGLAVAGGYAAALARLRHGSLALAATLAPLPGILWFGAASYALCVALAILMAAAFCDAMLKEDDGVAALAKPLPALAGTLVFALLWSLPAPMQVRGLFAASAATLLCLPPLALGVAIGEEAIVRGNRRRETMLRFLSVVARIAEPRWAISLCGVGLVLAVLAWFQILVRPPILDWLALPLIAAIVLALTRDHYCALAAPAASALLLLFIGGINGALLLFLLFALALGRAMTAGRGRGITVPSAWMRAVEGQGDAIFFAGLAAVIAATPRGGFVAAAHAVCGLLTALVLFPAIAVTLAHFFPSRRSLADLYRTSV
jgi:hypothetical protein